MATGCSNKEVSQMLHKSEGTIKNHVSNILSKLGVHDRTRAVLVAMRLLDYSFTFKWFEEVLYSRMPDVVSVGVFVASKLLEG